MAIGEEPPPTTTVVTDYCISTSNAAPEKRHRSVFELPTNFFDFSRVLPSPHFSVPSNYGTISENYSLETLDEPDIATDDKRSQNVVLASRLTCNTCEVEFQSLKDQRSHFKSDIHRFNVILPISSFHLFLYFHRFFFALIHFLICQRELLFPEKTY